MAAIYRALIGFAALAVAVAICLCSWLFLYTGDLPRTDQLPNFAPKAEGHLETAACLPGSSFVIPFNRIGKPVQDAMKAAEPSTTYAYQIARTLMCGRQENQARYQLTVFRLAWHIRRRFSEDELLTIYANQAYFGSSAVGIENGSRQFFQKEADGLTADEAALLAGVLRSPEMYSPFKHPDMALRRRNEVLQVMADQGKMSATELQRALAAPLNVQPPTPD